MRSTTRRSSPFRGRNRGQASRRRSGRPAESRASCRAGERAGGRQQEADLGPDEADQEACRSSRPILLLVEVVRARGPVRVWGGWGGHREGAGAAEKGEGLVVFENGE